MKVLVTGASGFLGGFACAELQRRGHQVSALVRRPESAPTDAAPVIADLTDSASLVQALGQAQPEAIVHLAAEIATQRDARRVREVNVEGTRRLLGAAVEAGVPRFVFTSTVVTGDAGGEMLTEDRRPPVETEYGRSKQDGEELVLQSGLAHVILRPSHVYGPGGWYAEEIVGRLRQPGRFAVVGSGQNFWDVVHVEDVASACADALERAPSGAIYHVVDDQPVRYRDFVGLTATALGLGAPRRVPIWLARLAAGPDPVRAVVRSARSSNARIKAELGWLPRFPSAEVGVPDAVNRLHAS
ncbi:MAG TPA: NAD(P)-dependent oxidoreductase [Solirubrobacteraceae bacterium]